MPRRVFGYATLLIAAFLIARWSSTTPPETIVSQTLQPVGSGLLETPEATQHDVASDLDLRTVTRVVDGDTLVLDGNEKVYLKDGTPRNKEII